MKRTFLLLLLPALLVSCRNLQIFRDESIKTEQIQYPMPQDGEVLYEGHGKEKWFAYGAMSGMEGTAANGVALAHRFEDNRYLHTIQLNILPPEDGFFYEGWLQNGDNLVSTGHLSNHFGDSRHGLRFEADEDYAEYLNVIVTLEKDDGNPSPGTHVAKGLLKVTQRKK